MSIEAMKQALEALEQIHPGNMTPMAENTWVTALFVLRQAIAEAEKQEPVAWVDVHDYTNLYYRKPAQVDVVPLYYGYTHPPKREWVGLTDEEIKPLCDENHIIYGAYTVDFIQAIEAKLKEKNT